MSMVNRRDLLRSAAVTAAAVATGCLATSSVRSVRAIEPIARTGKAKFKFSLAAYSYRDLLPNAQQPNVKNPRLGEVSLDDFIKDCARMGLEGTELTSYYFPKDVTPAYLRHLKQLTFSLGLDISGTSTANDFCFPAGPERDSQLAYTRQWIDYAEMMGAPVIRVFSGKAHEKQSPDDAHRLAVEGLEEACDYAGKHGVFLALENHGGLTTKVDDMLRIVRDVRSPWFGVNLDSGNFRSADPYADLAKIAPYTLNVQIKTMIQPEGAKAQKADFSRFAQILRDAGYRGYIVLEYEEKDDPRQACPKTMDELRAAFG